MQVHISERIEICQVSIYYSVNTYLRTYVRILSTSYLWQHTRKSMYAFTDIQNKNPIYYVHIKAPTKTHSNIHILFLISQKVKSKQI